MKPSDTIENILSDESATLDSNATISDAAGLFRQGNCRLILVLNQKGKAIGIVTERMITRGYINADTKLKSVYKVVPFLTPDTEIQDAAQIALDAGVRYLPVYQQNQFQGILSIKKVIEILQNKEFGDILVRDIMSQNPRTLPPHATIAQVLAITRAEGISRVPIVDNRKLEGIVTLHDIVSKVLYTGSTTRSSEMPPPKKPPLGNSISTIMTRGVITCPPNMSIPDAVKRMQTKSVSSLVIVENKEVQGILTRKDLLQLIARSKIPTAPPILIQMTFKTQPIEIFEKEQINAFLARFQDQFSSTLGNSLMTIYFKQHRSKRETPLIQCRVRITTQLGQFVAVAENWGWLAALQNTMENLERQLLHQKSILDEHQQLQRFINKSLSPWD